MNVFEVFGLSEWNGSVKLILIEMRRVVGKVGLREMIRNSDMLDLSCLLVI